MKYRMATARLVVASYGDEIIPGTTPLPHEYAEVLDLKVAGEAKPTKPGEPPRGKVTAGLEDVRSNWLSKEYVVIPTDPASYKAAADAATTEAARAIEPVLSKYDTGVKYEVMDNTPLYRPIYDANGKVVGHETVVWLYRNGAPMKYTTNSSSKHTLLGCIFLALAPA